MIATRFVRGADFVLKRSRPYIFLRMSSSSSAAAAAVAPIESNGAPKRKHPHDHHFKNKKQKTAKPTKDGSHEEVLLADVQALLQKLSVKDHEDQGSSKTDKFSGSKTLPDLQSELELDVTVLSSTGDALAFHEDSSHVYVVPFALPGDKVRAKVFKHFTQESYSLTDLVKVDSPSPDRNDSLIRCQYFAKCSGCQFQMLPYKKQLEHKRTIVEKAYRNFSDLESSQVPPVGDTVESPLQYGYRTKLTPHFDGPPTGRKDRRNGRKPQWPGAPPVGFMQKNTRKTLDIEDCPIGTDAVRLGIKSERARVAKQINTYQRGATLLVRESSERTPLELEPEKLEDKQNPSDHVADQNGNYIYKRTFITSQKATTREYVDDLVFENPAGAFFQNNNSILPSFIAYVKEHILPQDNSHREKKITHLIDAYCGSGLFTITLSSLFKRSIGIDISPSSIDFAKRNAELNNLPESQATFLSADASNIFSSVKDLPADETVVVIDPPRKGCDEPFLKLLLDYGPARIVYVSCNVHTQARDVGMLVRGRVDSDNGKPKTGYEIESLRGFDFFPQTGHVEGVAVLGRKIDGEANAETAPGTQFNM